MTEQMAGGIHFRQHAGGNSQPLQYLFVPTESVNIIQHGPGGIGIVRGMHPAPGEIPDQPGIHGAKKDFSPLRPLSDPRHMVQNPGDLGGAEIGVRHQPGPLPDQIPISLRLKLFYHFGSPAALPDDGIVHRFPGGLVPADGGLPLVSDADASNLLRPGSHHGHGFRSHRKLRGPDLPGIVLHPSRPGINLRKFFLGHGADITRLIKQNTAGTGGSLVQRHNVLFHLFLFSPQCKCKSFSCPAISPTASHTRRRALPRCATPPPPARHFGPRDCIPACRPQSTADSAAPADSR